jgi:hypothetical protein
LLKIKVSPLGVAGCDGSAAITISDIGVLNVGSGECLSKCPEGGNVPVVTTSRGNDLQACSSSASLPVENRFGNHGDTNILDAAQEIKGIQGQEKQLKITLARKF